MGNVAAAVYTDVVLRVAVDRRALDDRRVHVRDRHPHPHRPTGHGFGHGDLIQVP